MAGVRRKVFAGIDVAIARGKRLPVVVAAWEGGCLVPLPLKQAQAVPPQGLGVKGVLADQQVQDFAEATAAYLRKIEREFRVKIRRLALDASSAPKEDGRRRRRAEAALEAWGIGYIVSPGVSDFRAIIRKARDHLAAGGSPARLPHLNQLWMLAGFALFKRLRQEWDCLEVYPHALWVSLNAAEEKKTRPGGLQSRLAALARRTRWPLPPEPSALRQLGWGSGHDLLDAYAAAWVASLEAGQRQALGDPQSDDAIWLPRLDG